MLASWLQRRKHIHRAILGALACSLVACQTAVRATEWAEAKQAALQSMENGDCAALWRTAWPFAKRGELEAQAILGGTVYARALTPPGAGRDVLPRLRSILTLYSSSAANGDERSGGIIAGVLSADVFSEGRGAEHAACLREGDNMANCISAAIDDGLFPAFHDWAIEIDKLADGGSAECLRR